MDMSQYTVSKLADQVGTSADALRYYERIGLLPEPDRSPSGYRLYGEDAVERVRFIKQAQRFGLRLEAIGELLDIRERGACPCGHTRVLLERRLAEIDEELAALNHLRGDIAHMVEALPTTTEGWQCASELIQVRPRGSATSTNSHEETTS
jgi:DNA-binding transcriptional MerR regulator